MLGLGSVGGDHGRILHATWAGALFAPPAAIRARVQSILAEAPAVGHIFNLGHGVMPTTNPEHVRAMVEAVREFGGRS